MASVHFSNVYMNVVPVQISAGDKTINAFAFLDQGSTTSLCDKRLFNLLNITGESTAFTISTINEKASLCHVERVTLVVSSVLGKRSLLLQDVLSIGELPVKSNPVLSKKGLDVWPYLQNLPLPEINGDVLLLIGVNDNAPEEFGVPVMEERRGNIGDPYAVRTTLGWSLIGPRPEECNSLLCQNVGVNFISATKSELLDQQIECL